MSKLVWTKPWYRSRGIWGALLGASGTIYGLWAAILPCGPVQMLHNYASAIITLYGAYLGFVGRRTASQPVHFLWRAQVEVDD